MKQSKKVSDKRVTRSARLSREIIEGLNAITKDKNGLTQSRHIEIAVREYLAKKGAIRK